MTRWYVVTPGTPRRAPDGRWYVRGTVRVRRWHPGFWWYVVRALFRR